MEKGAKTDCYRLVSCSTRVPLPLRYLCARVAEKYGVVWSSVEWCGKKWKKCKVSTVFFHFRYNRGESAFWGPGWRAVSTASKKMHCAIAYVHFFVYLRGHLILEATVKKCSLWPIKTSFFCPYTFFFVSLQRNWNSYTLKTLKTLT